MKIIYNLCLLFLFTLLLSCGKEQFVANSQKDVLKTSASAVSSFESCGNQTKIKPAVDILFVFDNSTSTNFMTPSTKSAILKTITQVSDKFDYHIVVAPLIDNGNSAFPIVVSSPTGLGGVLSQIYPADQIPFPQAQNGAELGFQRVRTIISNNISNGIFRTGAYTIVVLVSNGDDQHYTTDPLYPQIIVNDFYTSDFLELKKFTKRYFDEGGAGASTLKSAQLRFMSVVAQNNCMSGWKTGSRYRNMSRDMYKYVFNVSLANNSLVDTFDLCTLSGSSTIFDDVNNKIQEILIGHKYDYWPVASVKNFDPTKIVVKKNGATLTSGDLLNGYVFEDLSQTKNTRYEPTPGEPYTGYLVKLYGNARVMFNPSTYQPDCMQITTQAPPMYYGYVPLAHSPDVNTIILKINGQTIPQATTNGWSYTGEYSPSKNIQVTSPTDETPALPGLFKTGYFLKLHGTAVYSDGASLEVDYKPSTN